MALCDRPVVICTIRFCTTLLLLLAFFLLSQLGGFLNRCRGGYVPLQDYISYWPAHELSREIFSLVTGALVVFSALHLRAGIIVWLLTQWSLFVGWGTYMNIGSVPTNYNSRSGIFDWMLGRQQKDWDYTYRFIREFSGMSLRGLVWTAPQGYALQQLGFGWQYSLSGSLMGLIYYAGSHMEDTYNTTFFDSTIAYSEYIWGVWVWFVLLITCITQLIHRSRKWMYSKSTSCGKNPYKRYNKLLYESLNYTVTDILYQLLMVLLWLALAASTVFYSLVIQPDTKNKGQTFFGLFMSVISLTFFGGWKWASVYTTRQLRRQAKNQTGTDRVARVVPPSIHGRMEGNRSELDPLLPWPYSHPDKVFMDRQKPPVYLYDAPRSSTPVSYGSYNRASPVSISMSSETRNRATLSTGALAYMLLCPSFEKWVWWDLFAILRHVIGFLSLLATVLTIVLSSIAFAMDLTSPRFDSEYFVCNSTVAGGIL